MYHETINNLEVTTNLTTLPQDPSLERSFSIEKKYGVSRTGYAQSRWTYHHAARKTLPGRSLIVGGFGGVEKSYYPVAEAMTALGADVITMELPTSQRGDHQYHPEHLLHPERLLAQMVLRIIKDTNKQFGPEKVDATGHSTGGPADAYAADREPELFNSITPWMPAGVSKKGIVRIGSRGPAVATTAARSRTKLCNNLAPLARPLALDYVRYTKNVPRRFLEAIAVTQSDIMPNLRRVEAAGVHIGMLLAANDKFFPLEEILPRINGMNIRFSVLDGCHVLPQTDPDLVAMSQVALLTEFHKNDSDFEPTPLKQAA